MRLEKRKRGKGNHWQAASAGGSIARGETPETNEDKAYLATCACTVTWAGSAQCGHKCSCSDSNEQHNIMAKVMTENWQNQVTVQCSTQNEYFVHCHFRSLRADRQAIFVP